MRIARIITPALAALLPAAQVFAANPSKLVPSCKSGGQSGVKDICGLCDLVTLANNAINLGIFLAVFFAACLFAYAGWLYMTARGESGQIKQAHGIFADVAIGFVIILAAWLVVDTLMHILTGKSDWSQIC